MTAIYRLFNLNSESALALPKYDGQGYTFSCSFDGTYGREYRVIEIGS